MNKQTNDVRERLSLKRLCDLLEECSSDVAPTGDNGQIATFKHLDTLELLGKVRSLLDEASCHPAKCRDELTWRKAIDEAVAGAFEAATDVIPEFQEWLDEDLQDKLMEAIRALTTAGQQATLERRDARVRLEEAKWWDTNKHFFHAHTCEADRYTCSFCQRIAALREKAK
jgi:hypothetical protein